MRLTNLKTVNTCGVDDPAVAMVEVTLSRRNLLALLHKLDMPDSEQTLERQEGVRFLRVIAEDDAEHYADRPPGDMYPATEAYIKMAYDRRESC